MYPWSVRLLINIRLSDVCSRYVSFTRTLDCSVLLGSHGLSSQYAGFWVLQILLLYYFHLHCSAFLLFSVYSHTLQKSYYHFCMAVKTSWIWNWRHYFPVTSSPACKSWPWTMDTKTGGIVILLSLFFCKTLLVLTKKSQNILKKAK